ncbi:MFS transporter [Modestobacter marinus]|uniref:MFS transporter n=1 Tax=Modestobacter marinus TaxID=477641 RepID=UPI001C96ACAC|nr:MFS transporter [Modestobacter marinus]
MSTTERRAHHDVTFAVLATGVVAFGLLQSLVTPVLPTLQEELHTNQADVTWIMTAYLLSASIFTPIMGRLGDMTGKKRMFVVALVALAVGCLVAALAEDLTVMIVARVVQGVGGGMLPLAFGIIRDELPGHRIAGAIGTISAMIAVGAGAGLVLAGPIVDVLDHTWLFWLPLIVLAVATLAAVFLVPESPVRTEGRINWAAALLLAGWLVALLLPVSQAPSWGWGSPRVLVLLAVAVVLAGGWVVVESRATHPLVDMRMMRIRAVWANNLVALLVGVAMYAAFAFLPQFVQTPPTAGYGFGASVTESGLMNLPQTVTSFVLGLMAGRIAARVGSKASLVAGVLVGGLGYLLFALVHDERWEIYASSAVIGAGFGLVFAAMSNLVVAAVPPHQTGVASGMNANIRTVGGAIGAAVTASVITAHAGPTGLPTEGGYVLGFLVLAAAMLLAALAALLIPGVPRDPRTHAEPDVEYRHPEAALVAGGTLVGKDSE